MNIKYCLACDWTTHDLNIELCLKCGSCVATRIHTPRVDCRAFDIKDDGTIRRNPNGEYITAEDAREIEAELIELREQVIASASLKTSGSVDGITAPAAMTLERELSEAQKALTELRDKITTWSDEAREAVEGRWGKAPNGYSLEHWEGRKQALGELRAFLPQLGENYVHISEVDDLVRKKLKAN